MLFCKQCFLKVLSIVFRTCHPRIIGGTFLQRDMARLRLFMLYLYEKKVLSSSEDQEEELLRYADSTGLAARKVG